MSTSTSNARDHIWRSLITPDVTAQQLSDAGEASGLPQPADSFLLRGLTITRSSRGGNVYSLQKPYPHKRDARVHGHNDLPNGSWWPLQVCMLRDGAHGSYMGGIHGSA